MGADFIDYIIGDAIVTPPESADDFTEKLVILPDSYQANDYQQIISSKPVLVPIMVFLNRVLSFVVSTIPIKLSRKYSLYGCKFWLMFR